MKKPYLIGHRANSLRKLLRYILEGIDHIELDVTYSNRLRRYIVRHPPNDGTHRYHGNEDGGWLTKLYTNLYLRGYIPLQNYLEILSTNVTPIKTVMIDVKTPIKVMELEKELTNNSYKGEIILTSKDHKAIKDMSIDDIKMFITLTERLYKPTNYLSQFNIDGLSIDIEVINEEYLNELATTDLEISIWTVNTEEQLNKIRNEYVDYIITDKPWRLKTLFKGD